MTDRGDPSYMERQGRRRVTSEEFEPLTSRQEALGAGGGACRKGLRWMRGNCLEVVIALWAGAIVFCLIGINSGVRNPPQAPETGVNLEALLPTLVPFKTDFFTLLTTPLTSKLLLMELPASVVAGETVTPFIFGASFARGAYDDHSSVTLLHYPAENTDETVFVFRLTEDLSGVDVLREQLTLRTSDEGMVTSLSESAPPEWIATLPVLQYRAEEGGNGSFLTSAESLLTNGFFVTDIQEAMLSNMRVRLSETKAYPRNAALTVEYQLIAPPGGEPGNVIPVSIRFSIAALPAEPMKPRWSDERVGYFNTVFQDLGDHRAGRQGRNTDLLDTEVTLINRRRMSSGNSGSDPLTYYVDPSVPLEWRAYLRVGVESWRPAFEAAGLGAEAIRAVLPGEKEWPEDYDAGDIRFNSITWAVDVDQVFALGPATLDPRTGEILHSGIVFTHGWLRSWSAAFEIYGDSPDASARPRSLLESSPLGNPSDTARPHGHPRGGNGGHSHPHSHSHSHGGAGHRHGGGEGGDEEDPLMRIMPSLGGGGRRHGASGSLRYHRRSECQEARLMDVPLSLLALAGADGRSRHLADGEEARGSAPGVATDEILGAGLADVVMHEVGHTLGLRHNFEGSTKLTLEELQDPAKTSVSGLTSSVMDYLPLNIVSSKMQGADEPHYFTTRVGEYDMWAIKYGYMELEGEEMIAQSEGLAEVASLALPFSTDEDGADSSGINPMASVFDLGKEPMDYWEDRLELVTELWPVLLARSTAQGESQFGRYGQAGMSLLRQVVMSAMYATKYIGGFDIDKQRRENSDTPGPIQLVHVDRQRRALALVLRVVGGDEDGGSATFLPSGEDFSNLAMFEGVCEGLEQYCYAIQPVDVLSLVSALRKAVLLQAFSVDRVRRLRLQSWAAAATSASGDGSGDALTVTEMLDTTTRAIWGDAGFGSERAKLWQNWDMMLFWLEVLQAYGSAGVIAGVPGDVTATAAGMVYSIVESGGNITASDAAFGLHRAASRKLHAWEEHGTDGFVLGLLGGVVGVGKAAEAAVCA